MKKNTSQGEELFVAAPLTGSMTLFVKGLTPFIANAPSEKAKHELLLPKRKSAAERNASLKHVPLDEYRNSVYAHSGDNEPTRIFFPAGAFKKACMSAAIETGGATKASIARLIWITDYNVSIYGVPQMLMSVTRSADINHTPDIRTRAIIPDWAAKLTINFMKPKLNEQVIANLMVTAGLIIGVGDWRQEKGSASFGQFTICSEEEFTALAEVGGREAQDAALASLMPTTFDIETERLYAWYVEEVQRRRQAGDAAAHSQHRKELSTNGDQR